MLGFSREESTSSRFFIQYWQQYNLKKRFSRPFHCGLSPEYKRRDAPDCHHSVRKIRRIGQQHEGSGEFSIANFLNNKFRRRSFQFSILGLVAYAAAASIYAQPQLYYGNYTNTYTHPEADTVAAAVNGLQVTMTLVYG